MKKSYFIDREICNIETYTTHRGAEVDKTPKNGHHKFQNKNYILKIYSLTKWKLPLFFFFLIHSPKYKGLKFKV